MRKYVELKTGIEAIHTCPAPDCTNNKPGYYKFCVSCNRKYNYDSEAKKWFLSPKYDV